LGKCTFQPEEPQEANEYFEKSVESFRKAIQLNQRSLSNQFDCSVALRLLGETYISLREDQKAQRSFEEAHALAMKLADNNPEVVSYQTQLAHLDRSLGACYASQENWEKSEKSWKQALEITRKYQSLSPDNELLLGDLVTCLSALGDLAQRKGDDQTARRLRQESIPGLSKLTASYPDDQELQEQLKQNIKWLESHKQ
jgi:tetratricopeptide (TPR) repeat protein